MGIRSYIQQPTESTVYYGSNVNRNRGFIDIVRSGLVLNLDAGNTASYPGSGTTWFDLSGNGNNGTLVNNPTFNSGEGSFIYTSSNITTVPMSGLRPTSEITQEAWILISNNTAQVFIGSQYGSSSDNSYAIWLNGANTWTGGIRNSSGFNYQSYNATVTTNIWYHFVHTYDGSNQRLYLNGSQVHSWATSGSITYDTNNTLLAVGNDWNGPGYNVGASVGIQGKLSNVKIYNRALTASEIQQNYNALRGRFGI